MLTATAGPDWPSISRRRLLAGAGALAVAWSVAGCTGDDPEPGPSQPSTPPPDPDAPRRAEVLSGAEALAAAYGATIAAHPDLEPELAPLLADHTAHIAALSPPSATPTPSPGESSAGSAPPGAGTASPTPTPGGPAPASVPTDPDEARSALTEAERAAGGVARNDAVSAADPDLARLFASISASRSLHAAALDAA